MTDAYQHWHFEVDEEHIAWLSIDRAESTTNTLSHAVLGELEILLTHIAEQKNLKGLIIGSGKDTGFIAGADITQFTELTDVDQAIQFIQQGQYLFDKIEALSIPTVAMIDGFCLGGGMELALGCDYRVASDDLKTVLGLPEVKLGIHPGFGGSVRMPKLIGVLNGLEAVVSGRVYKARAAFKLGMVDALTPRRHLRAAALHHIRNKPARKPNGLLDALLNLKFMRPLVAKLFYRKLKQKIRQTHYPAPFAVVENWQKHGLEGRAPYQQEARSIAKLIVGSTAQNLVRVFLLQDQLKSFGKQVESDIQHVHVVGAGTMGGDIAAWCALRGMKVTLQDREPKYIAPAIARAADLYKKKLKSEHLVSAALDRLIPDPKGEGVGRADLVIEAIFENLEAKQDLFKTIERKLKPSAFIASNTSSIPLEELAAVLVKPERLVGLHFFNPVAKMPLVEVVHSTKTARLILKQSYAFARKIDRLPLPVKSAPGFLVNRVLMPYMLEAMTIYQEGVDPKLIDKAAMNFGMPMGPIELADVVGLDVCLSVADILTQHFGGSVPEQLRTLVKNKQLGRKTGAGFYTHSGKKTVAAVDVGNKIIAEEVIQQRLVFRMLQEAQTCLQEGIIESADLADAGMIFGTGFAPFRGGIMHYAESLGPEKVRTTFSSLQANCGERFAPSKETATAQE